MKNTHIEEIQEEVLLPIAQCPTCDAYNIWASTVKPRMLKCHDCGHEYQEVVPQPDPVKRLKNWRQPIPQSAKERLQNCCQ